MIQNRRTPNRATEPAPRGFLLGSVLALILSLLFGAFLAGGLWIDHFYFAEGRLTAEVRTTLALVSSSGALSCLLSWGVLRFFAGWSLAVRGIAALLLLSLFFIAIGGTLTALYEFVPFPGKGGPTYQWPVEADPLLMVQQGMAAFWAWLTQPLRLSLLGLLPAMAMVLAVYSPQHKRI